jgi:hypothetical protein
MTGPPQNGKPQQSEFRGKNKMLPPHLHLKGWDVSADRFREWYRSIELFFVANDVPRDRWGPPIVAACFDRAHQALRNLDVMRLTESGAVDAITYILASTFLRPHEDKSEEYEKRYRDFRRQYGMPMHDYIQEFEVIEAAFLAEDAGTVLSEQSRAKRLLDNACLRDWEKSAVRATTYQSYDYRGFRTALLIQYKDAHLNDNERRNLVRFGTSQRGPTKGGRFSKGSGKGRWPGRSHSSPPTYKGGRSYTFVEDGYENS